MRQPEFFLAQRKEGVQLNPPELIEDLPAPFLHPGGWHFNSNEHQITYRPPLGQDVAPSTFVAPRLETLLELHGTPELPVRNLVFEGLCFPGMPPGSSPIATGFVDVQANFRGNP